MWNRSILIQIKLLFWITIVNFIAQIPYYFQLYYHKTSDLVKMLNVPMILVFVLFVIAYLLLNNHKKTGYWLMVVFLSVEFLFYLSNAIFSFLHGYGPFFQLYNPNLILKVVFAIGYINLFASGYFLFLFLYKRRVLTR